MPNLIWSPTDCKNLECEDFEEGRHWLHPEVTDVINKDPNTAQVLPVTNDYEFVFTAKIIPIPLFPSPTISWPTTLQRTPLLCSITFTTRFYGKCAPSMKLQTQYIYDFLLAACGTEEAPKDTDFPTSHLAISMEELELDTILMQWAMYQFGGTMHIANLHDISKGDNKKKIITKNCEGIDADEGIHGNFIEGAIIPREGDQVPGPNLEAHDSSQMPYRGGFDAEVGMHGNQPDEAISPREGNVMHVILPGSRTPARLPKNCGVSGAVSGIRGDSATFTREGNTTSQQGKTAQVPNQRTSNRGVIAAGQGRCGDHSIASTYSREGTAHRGTQGWITKNTRLLQLYQNNTSASTHRRGPQYISTVTNRQIPNANSNNNAQLPPQP